MICEGKGCKAEAELSLWYDCGVGPDQVLLLCQKHYDSDSIFGQHIRKIEKIKPLKEMKD